METYHCLQTREQVAATPFASEGNTNAGAGRARYLWKRQLSYFEPRAGLRTQFLCFVHVVASAGEKVKLLLQFG